MIGVIFATMFEAAVGLTAIARWATSLATFRRKIREPKCWGRIGAVAIFCKPGRISIDGGARR
jgi:hypothetical protein